MQYALRKNPLKADEQLYYAQIENRTTYDFGQLLQEVTREGSILKDTETEAVIRELFKQLARLMKEGIAFRSEYFSMVPGIRGSFQHSDDSFDPNRHKVVVNVTAGRLIGNALQQVRPVKTDLSTNLPEPQNLLDNNTELVNSTISAGHIMELKGKNLSISKPDDPSQGVFLIKADDNETVKIDWLKINRQRLLTFKVPADLPAGSYYLELRNNYGSSEDTLRTGRLKYLLELS